MHGVGNRHLHARARPCHQLGLVLDFRGLAAVAEKSARRNNGDVLVALIALWTKGREMTDTGCLLPAVTMKGLLRRVKTFAGLSALSGYSSASQSHPRPVVRGG
jgi:hypothetical protein